MILWSESSTRTFISAADSKSMKLTPEQHLWFSHIRREWLERLSPASTTLGAHLFEVPARLPQDAVKSAKLFSDRMSALETYKTGGIVAEIGTQTGWYARRILDQIEPERLHLFDLEFETLRSHNAEVATDSRTILHLGDSSSKLATLPDGLFDWIYIDGDHELDGVRRDAECACQKIKPEGFLVFNDYTFWSPMEMIDYGVVPVVNELLASGAWEVMYFAFHPLMYCDIAIRRSCA